MFSDESKNAEGRFNLSFTLRLIINSSYYNLLTYASFFVTLLTTSIQPAEFQTNNGMQEVFTPVLCV
jgi:hypothetical protein